MIMEYKKQRHPGRLHYCSWMPEPKLHVRKHNKQFSYIIIKKKQKTVSLFLRSQYLKYFPFLL